MAALAELVDDEHILLDVSATSAEEIIRLLAGHLERSGHATAGFADACVARERAHPTGLPTEQIAVAIPHADPEFVRRAAVVVAVPRDPIPFSRMDDPAETIPAQAVFLLALPDGEGQLAALRQVAALVQDGDRLAALVEADDVGRVRALLTDPEREMTS